MPASSPTGNNNDNAGFLVDGPEAAEIVVLLAHGAGAPMDSPWMAAMATALAATGLGVVRFEFAYMAARRTGARKAPPRADSLVAEYRTAVARLEHRRALIIGGKSMGGRVASLVADELYAEGRIAGLVCLGYPFHPPGKPAQLRTAHLSGLTMPTLVCQGARDPFGNRQEVSGYALSERIALLWVEDGDHDLKPRKAVSGLSLAEQLGRVAIEVRAWADRSVP